MRFGSLFDDICKRVNEKGLEKKAKFGEFIKHFQIKYARNDNYLPFQTVSLYPKLS